jgi:predicted phosphodiesterase
MMEDAVLKTSPAVFAVRKNYQILVQTKTPCLLWVCVGETEYYDESNGIMRSLSELHRVTVPMETLDTAREYTIYVRPLIKRKPYFTETAPIQKYTYAFRPVPSDNVRAYHIADAHNRIEEPVAAAKAFGNIDLLILNGDVIDHSGDPSKFDNIYIICDRLTGGNIPVIFSRGNHDMRGNFAEKFAEYTPNTDGNTYYTFRLGGIWGILLDCGEDKTDDHAEYGHTVCCHHFRKRQSAFLRDIICRKDSEYEENGVNRRLVISHNPFTYQLDPPFDIEKEIYTEWATLLSDHIHPDVMICGHLHRIGVFEKGGELDHLGQPCTLIVGANPEKDRFVGCGYIFGKTEIKVIFTDSNGRCFDPYRIV